MYFIRESLAVRDRLQPLLFSYYNSLTSMRINEQGHFRPGKYRCQTPLHPPCRFAAIPGMLAEIGLDIDRVVRSTCKQCRLLRAGTGGGACSGGPVIWICPVGVRRICTMDFHNTFSLKLLQFRILVGVENPSW